MRWLSTSVPPALPLASARAFESEREGRRIPGLLYLPERAAGPVPLVLVQHGGSGHKGDASVLELAAALVARGIGVAAIDGLLHGERRAEAAQDKAALLQEFLAFWRAGGGRGDLIEDWLQVIASLRELPEVAGDRLGWCGLSMGTAYGLGVLARCPAIGAAVIGKWSAAHDNSAVLLDEAAQVQAATLFVQHWDDELFDRQGTLDVFSALACADKRLVAYPGGHFGRSAEELALCVDFLERCLRG
jgi:dienelactone hydrolase